MTGDKGDEGVIRELDRGRFQGSSKEPRPEERQRVHVLFDEIQIAIYHDDRERVDLLMVKLALATTHQRRTNS